MPIKAKCNHCQTLISAPDNLAGQRAKCPKCAAQLLIPPPANSAIGRPTNAAGPTKPAQPPKAPASSMENDFGLGDAGTGLEGDIDLSLDLASMPALASPTAAPAMTQQSPASWSRKSDRSVPSWMIVAGGGVGVLVLLIVGQLIISAMSLARQEESAPPPEVATTSPVQQTAPTPSKSAPLISSKPIAPSNSNSTPSNSVASKSSSPSPAAKTNESQSVGSKAAKSSKQFKEEQVLELAHNSICHLAALDGSGHEIAFSTGFLINETGTIATDFEAIKYARNARVRFRDGSILSVIGYRGHDVERNIVLLDLSGMPKTYKTLKLRADAAPKEGTEVVAVGYSKALDYVTARGTVRATGIPDELPKEIQDGIRSLPDDVWISTDADMAGGISGFPLLNIDGEVIGMSSWNNENLTPGLAIHAKHIQALVDASTQPPVTLKQVNTVLGAKGWFRPRDAKIQLAATMIRTLSEINPPTDDDRFKLSREFGAILNQLTAEYQDNAALAGLFLELQDINLFYINHSGKYSNWLRQIIRKTKDPDVYCAASIALAGIFSANQLAYADYEAEILAMLERVMTKYGDVPLAQTTYGELASLWAYEIQTLAVGKQAPDIVGYDSESKELRLSDLRGKIVLLNFFSECAPAQMQMYDEVHDTLVKYPDLPVTVVGVNCDLKEAFPRIRTYMKINYRCFLDGPHGPIADRWRANLMPYTYVLDKQGVIRFKYAGNARAYVGPAIDDLLSGRMLASNTQKIDLNAEIESLDTQVKTKPIAEIVENALAQVQSQRETVTKKQLASIEEWILKGLQEDPESYSLHLSAAVLLLIRDEVPLAITQLRELLKRKDLDKKQIVLLKNQLALVLVTQSDDAAKNAQEAFELIEDAMKRGGEEIWLLHTRGMVYYALKLYREAHNDLTKVLVANPEPLAYFHLAQIELALRNPAGARESLHRALYTGLRDLPLGAYEQKQLKALAKATNTFMGKK